MLIISTRKTFYLFVRDQKIRGVWCFLGGILLVFFARRFIVPIVQIFGVWDLFGYVAKPTVLILGIIINFVMYRYFFIRVLAPLRKLRIVKVFLRLPYVRDVDAAFVASSTQRTFL